MRLRTFTAPDMPAAMKLVRQSLGEDAVILNFEQHRGNKAISVTAAIDMRDEQAYQPKPSSAPRDKAAADALRFEVQNVLRFHNLPELFVAKMMHKAPDSELAAILMLHRSGSQRDQPHLTRLAVERLAGVYFRFEPLSLDGQHTRIMLAGPPGAGKTLTAAKIAAQMTMEKQDICVVTTDNKRAGGIEQLQAFTAILGLELRIAATRAELWQHVRALPAHTPAIIDTAGCNPFDRSELHELAAYGELDGVEPVLVLPAGGDSLEAIDMVETFAAALPLQRLLVTRTDTARRFGGVLAAAAAHNLAFCNASGSASIVDALKPMSSPLLAQFMLKYQL